MDSVLGVQVDRSVNIHIIYFHVMNNHLSSVDLEKPHSIEQLSSMTIVCLEAAEKLQVHIEVASCGEEL